MNRSLTACMLLGILLAFQACGGGSSDPKAVLGDLLTATENYIRGIEKAAGPRDMVAATDRFARIIAALAPRLKALMKAHPELKNMKAGRLPPGFEAFRERFEAVGPRMMAVMGKMRQYGDDATVKAANQRLQEVMQKLNE